jgi:hypothetical protein
MNVVANDAQSSTHAIGRDFAATDRSTDCSGGHLCNFCGITDCQVFSAADCQTFHEVSKAQAMTQGKAKPPQKCDWVLA